MATATFGLGSIAFRFVFAFALVCLTWNPTRFNYIAWADAQWGNLAPLVLFVGIALLAGWLFFIRTAASSLGVFGFLLCAALAGTVFWTLFYFDLVNRESTTLLSWLVLIAFSAILAMGMSWAHLRRRWSGQATVDDVDR